MIFVDTNILIDISGRNPTWLGWSRARLVEASLTARTIINPVVYAEFSMGFATNEACQRDLSQLGLVIVELPIEALFRAGQAFKRYRQSGGQRSSLLPDFFIGAHAEVLRVPILTRDERRYRTYFPDVRLITPE